MGEHHDRIRRLDDLTTSVLWQEIAKRLKIEFGRIQMVFHGGKPSKYAYLDYKVDIDEHDVERANNA